MINIASIYYFSFTQDITQNYKSGVNSIIENIQKYIKEEWINFNITKKKIGPYEVISFILPNIWTLHLFNRNKKENEFAYYPRFFCDIYIEKKLLHNPETTKRVIFFLSNIFECFDEFEEKNIMIEFHKDIEETLYNSKQYTLRFDFLNINSLSKIYDEERISHDIKNFISWNPLSHDIDTIKNRFPEVYRTLLMFLYNIFALQKNFDATNKKLKDIKKFQETNWENFHIGLSKQRLTMNQQSMRTILNLYKTNFESFMNIFMHKN